MMNENELPPGRELDALVAVKLFGWRWVRFGVDNLAGLVPPASISDKPTFWHPVTDGDFERYGDWDRLGWDDKGSYHRGFPYYSTDWTAVPDIIAALKERGYDYLSISIRSDRATVVLCSLTNLSLPDITTATGNNVPHAICLAALAAVREKPEVT